VCAAECVAGCKMFAHACELLDSALQCAAVCGAACVAVYGAACVV